jgi:hypothetical protein
MNSALNDRRSPFGQAASDYVTKARSGESYRKLEKAFDAAHEPHAKAAKIGALIKFGMLRVASGTDGGSVIEAVTKARGFPIESDRPYEARLAKAVAAKLADTPGTSSWSGNHARSGVGHAVRALKKAADANFAPMTRKLPVSQRPGGAITEGALEVINTLPDGRQRNAALTALMARPPASPNDAYRWRQSIVELRDKIQEMLGDEAKPLIDSLNERIGEDGEISFYDPMVQSKPPSHHPRGSNLGPSADNPSAWPSELRPPAREIDPGPFANSGGNSD